MSHLDPWCILHANPIVPLLVAIMGITIIKATLERKR